MGGGMSRVSLNTSHGEYDIIVCVQNTKEGGMHDSNNNSTS